MFGQKLSNGKYKFSVKYTDDLTGFTRKITIIRNDNTLETQHDVMRIISEKMSKSTNK